MGFPCNQFKHQEQGANATEIYNNLKYVRPGNGFEPNFPLSEKLDVNGVNETLLYKDIKSVCPPPDKSFRKLSVLEWSPLHGDDIRWNFEKILIDKTGKPRYRFEIYFQPADMVQYIDELLAEED